MINIVYMEEPAIYAHHSIIIKLKILPVRSLQVATYTTRISNLMYYRNISSRDGLNL